MYAIIETGGKQLKVEAGDAIFVEKLEVEAGEKVTFDKVLLVGDETVTIGAPYVEGVPPVKSPEYPECESPSTRRPAGSHWRAHSRWRRPESTPRPFCR